MKITFFSFMIAVFWSSILTVIIYFCRKKHMIDRSFGVSSLSLLYLFCIVRMLFPIDFTFTRGIPLEGIISDFYKAVYLEKIVLGPIRISALSIGIGIWFTVSAGLLMHFYYQYYRALKEVGGYNKWADKQCKPIFLKVQEHYSRKLRIDILRSGDINIPMGVGIWKRRIILPEEDYTDTELYYILLHEYTHFQNRDVLVKMLVYIFSCVFWWNPVIYLLRKDLDRTLEIKCDLHVTQNLTNEHKADYLTVIVSTLKRVNHKKMKNALHGTVALAENTIKNEMLERFQMVSANHGIRNKSRRFTVGWIGVFMTVLVLSYSFVIQPKYEAPVNEIEQGTGKYEITSESTYILENADGTYTLVMPDKTNIQISMEQAIGMKEHGFEIKRRK